MVDFILFKKSTAHFAFSQIFQELFCRCFDDILLKFLLSFFLYPFIFSIVILIRESFSHNWVEFFEYRKRKNRFFNLVSPKRRINLCEKTFLRIIKYPTCSQQVFTYKLCIVKLVSKKRKSKLWACTVTDCNNEASDDQVERKKQKLFEIDALYPGTPDPRVWISLVPKL